jgi:hypothetical protein
LVLKALNLYEILKIFEFFPKYMGKVFGAGAGAGARSVIVDKLEPEPHKNGPASQHWLYMPGLFISKDIFEIMFLTPY